jgi:hypothetical protein
MGTLNIRTIGDLFRLGALLLATLPGLRTYREIPCR